MTESSFCYGSVWSMLVKKKKPQFGGACNRKIPASTWETQPPPLAMNTQNRRGWAEFWGGKTLCCGPQRVDQMFSSHQVSNTGSLESLLHIIPIALRCKIRFSDCNSDFQKYNWVIVLKPVHIIRNMWQLITVNTHPALLNSRTTLLGANSVVIFCIL